MRAHRIYLILSLESFHHMGMSAFWRWSELMKLGRRAAAGLLACLMVLPNTVVSSAQTPSAPTSDKATVDHYYDPLPQETGAAGLKLMLRRLQTTGRLMQVVAHPDDEDGGMLTLEARGKGVSTLLMTLTRGEGGQNKLGSNLFDVLGVLRTLELLASDRYYGVEQRFSRVADFGYSKTPEETFQKWQGHNVALGDLVRVIRTFRPDVLVARFSGTDRDGHGHHQASSILTQEAFRAAADPKRFPEQIAEGLQPWQAKKLYSGNVCGFFSSTCDASNYTVRLNTGVKDPVLGTSYIHFALKGLRHQLSQGSGTWTVDDGDRFTHYKLLDSVADSAKDKDGHEQDFFDGIDTTLPGLAARFGDEEKTAPWLRPALVEIQAKIGEARAAADKDSLSAAEPLAEASNLVMRLSNQIRGSQLSANAKSVLREELVETLGTDIENARALAEGAQFKVEVDAPVGSSPEDGFMAVPGQSFDVTASFSAASPSIRTTDIRLELPPGWTSTVLAREHSKDMSRFRVQVPRDASVTRPYWHRNDPERDTLNTIDDARYRNLPFAPPPVKAVATVAKGGVISATCMVRYKDASGNVAQRPLAVAPAFSVAVQPSSAVIPTSSQVGTRVGVSARDGGTGSDAQISTKVPPGWRSEPKQLQIKISKDQTRDSSFEVFPSELKECRAEVGAELRSANRDYDEGYSVVTREDLGTAYYYQPAAQRVSMVDVKVPKNLKIGYIMGAGDEIPPVLRELGIEVTTISAEKVAAEDLGSVSAPTTHRRK
jgi:LmbE family N-acetylglucosaminyl deacetylase